MQLASQSREIDQKVSPSIYAALIDSLFRNPAPLYAGAVLVAIAAAMTAAKTGEVLLWPCVALLIATGVGRAVDMQWYKIRRSALTAREVTRWEVGWRVGGGGGGVALGIWCSVALLASDD